MSETSWSFSLDHRKKHLVLSVTAPQGLGGVNHSVVHLHHNAGLDPLQSLWPLLSWPSWGRGQVEMSPASEKGQS